MVTACTATAAVDLPDDLLKDLHRIGAGKKVEEDLFGGDLWLC
jgi:hypothetical protein